MIPLIPSSDLKQWASRALNGRWGLAIGATVLYSIIVESVPSIVSTITSSSATSPYSYGYNYGYGYGAYDSSVSPLVVILSLASVAIMIFINGPMDVGLADVFLRIRDGQPAEITLVGDCMIGVELSGGVHTVSFIYRNPAFGLGWKISLLCGTAFLLLVQLVYRPDWKGMLAKAKEKYKM